MSQTEKTRDPEAIRQDIEQTQQDLAEAVEHVAYHKAHLKEEVTEAAKAQVVEAKDELIDNVTTRTGHLKDTLTEKAHDLKDTLTEKKDDLKETVAKKTEDIKETVAEKKEDLQQRANADGERAGTGEDAEERPVKSWVP